MILAGERLSPEEDVTGGGGWCKQGAAGLWCWRGVQAVQAAPRPSYVSQPRLDQLLLGSGRATLLLYKYKYKNKYKYEYKYNQLLLGSSRQQASHHSPLPQPQSAYWSATHDFLQLEQQDPLQGICDIA